MDPAALTPDTDVVLRAKVWGRVQAETVIVQLPSGALVAVPVEDLEPGRAEEGSHALQG